MSPASPYTRPVYPNANQLTCTLLKAKRHVNLLIIGSKRKKGSPGNWKLSRREPTSTLKLGSLHKPLQWEAQLLPAFCSASW